MYKHLLVAYDETDGSKKALDEALKLTKLSPDTKLTLLYVSEEKGTMETRDHYTPTHALADTAPGFDNQYMGNLSASRDEKLNSNKAVENNQGITAPSSSHAVLRNAKEKLDHYQLNINYVHLSGTEAKRICEYAKDSNADLVLVGNTGKSNIKKWVLGSVSEKVAHNCETSVLLVK
ncbi:universal stress protein [Mangrovibacillus sp. Mu-81]|jgi:nucleotide-binding universal stress UspA family protein|uniref:universal stress protein n=1 Tax=Mangrovibacillus sp. Mu-81 TaxID=3121478 RepID=UPI002FE44CCF